MYPNNNRVQYPILGLLTAQQLQDALMQAITSEATAIDFYTRLLNEAPNRLQFEFIQDAHDDEVSHKNHFEWLYNQYYGMLPQYQIQPVQYPSYKEGILMALEDELRAAAFYRDVQLSVNDPIVRDYFYLPMVDEMEHATQFSTLFNQL
jgi:rubrerythrin